MTRKLQIDELFLGNFGGVRNHRLVLPGSDLVIVYGNNESGKSTASTLMSWLLVGPYGSSEAAQRFGDPGERLTGHLSGTFNGEPLRIEGQFNVLKTGAPNPNGVKASFQSKELSIEEWRQKIGGIDPAVLNAVYRMWGGDLHDSSGVLAEVAQVALAGLGVGVRLGEVRERLDKEIKGTLTSNARDAESRHTVNQRITTVKRQIEEIEEKGEEFVRLGGELERLEGRLLAARSEYEKASAELGSLKTLQSVETERRREKEIAEELGQLETAPEPWKVVMENYSIFKSLASDLDTAESKVEEARDEVVVQARSLGLDPAQAKGLAVTGSTVSSVVRIHTQLNNVESNSESLRQDLKKKNEELSAAESKTRDSLTQLEAVGISVERSAVPTEEELFNLNDRVTEWSRRDEKSRNLRREVSSAQERVDEASALCEQARIAWDRLGTGLTARQWTLSPKAPVSTDSSGPFPRNHLYAALIAVAAVLVSALVLPRIITAVVAAVALASVAAAIIRKAPVATISSSSQASPGSLEAVGEGANKVVEAEGVLDNLTRDLAREKAMYESAQRAMEDARADALSEFRGYGIQDDRTLTQIEGCMTRLSEYRRVSLERDSLSGSAQTLEENLNEVLGKSAEFMLDLEESLANAGIPEQVDALYAAANIGSFQELTVRCSELNDLEESLEGLLDRWNDLTNGAAPSSQEWSRDRIASEAERLWEIHEERRILEEERVALEKAITGRLRTDSRAKELSSTLRMTSQIEEEIERRSQQVGELDEEIAQVNQSVGEARRRQDELADVDRLRELNLELGQLTERAEELLVRGVVLSAAKTILDLVSNERRRTHQPEMIARANSMLTKIIPEWETLILDPADAGAPSVTVVRDSGHELAAFRLSTGAQAVTNLAVRLATARSDSEKRQVCFPMICDDPLVHLDDDRARTAMSLLGEAAREGHQVILFTCHGRTVEAGREIGAPVVRLS